MPFSGVRVITVSLVAIVVLSVSVSAEPPPRRLLSVDAEGIPQCSTEGAQAGGECSLWISPNVITASDPSWLRSVEYVGRGEREFWDFLSNGWVARNAYLFDVQYGARQDVTEFQLHPEYGSREAAQEQVDAYAPMLGRLPLVLLLNVREVEVQIASADPTQAGANEGLGIIHINTYQAETAVLEGFMEEILLHEGAHASLDGDHARSPNWRAAQEADGRFLNSYAMDHPEREDIAETTWAYFVTHYRPGRIAARDVDTILAAIPSRLDYFDAQRFDMSPYTRVATVPQPPEPVPTMLTLSAALTPAEGGDPVTVTATLDNPVPATGMTVTLTLGGTATLDTDYTLSSTTITVAAGATAGTATITVTDDAEDDDGETIVIDAESTNPALTAEQLTLTIEDNDVTQVPALPLGAAILLGLLLTLLGAVRMRMRDRTDTARG